MVVVAVGLALAERQRARQVAGLRVAVVEEQLFEPRPGLLGQGLPRSCALAVVLEDRFSSNTSPFGLQPDEGEVGGLAALPSPWKAPRFSSAPSSASCGASSVCACALGRRRAGLVVEDVGHAGRQEVDAVGIAGQRDARCADCRLLGARFRHARVARRSARARSQSMMPAASLPKRGHQTASTSAGSASLGKALRGRLPAARPAPPASRGSTPDAREAVQDLVEQRAALGRARDRAAAGRAASARGSAAHRSHRDRGAASRSR